jgi:hypothetical protein
MKKSSRTTRRTKAALTAAAMSIPMLGAVHEAAAQETPTKTSTRLSTTTAVKLMSTRTVKLATNVILIGLDSGHVVYRNKAGELFYLDAATGDMRFLATTSPAVKLIGGVKGLEGVKRGSKDLSAVSIVGVDANGNVLHRTSKGEEFILDSTTGDMVFVSK